MLMVRRIQNDDKIQHYGVKGMKWGVRRSNPSGSKPSAKTSSSKAKMDSARVKMKSAQAAYLKKKEARDNEYYSKIGRAHKQQDIAEAILGDSGSGSRSFTSRVIAELSATSGEKYKKLDAATTKAYKQYSAAKKEYKNAKKEYKTSLKNDASKAKATASKVMKNPTMASMNKAAKNQALKKAGV